MEKDQGKGVVSSIDPPLEQHAHLFEAPKYLSFVIVINKARHPSPPFTRGIN